MEKLKAAAVKRKQPIPAAVVPRPELHAHEAFYYTAYCELQSNGFNFSETLEYAKHYGINFEQLRHVLRVMSNGATHRS